MPIWLGFLWTAPNTLLGLLLGLLTFQVPRLAHGLVLFDRSAYRPRLTDAGQRFYARALAVVAETEALRSFGLRLAGAPEPVVRLVLEAITPLSIIVPVLPSVKPIVAPSTLSICSGPLAVIADTQMDNCGTLPDFGNFCINRSKPENDSPEAWAKTVCLEEYDRYKGVAELMPFARWYATNGAQGKKPDNPEMLRAMRVHANFVEYVPITLLLIFMLEMQGGSAFVTNLLCLVLLAGRVVHDQHRVMGACDPR